MKILLLNENPVVHKLVTLSAQKTSDDLEVMNTLNELHEGSYDLLVVDDTLYTDTIFEILKEKISFKKSLYICSRDAETVEAFNSTLKKPFLPTDLVELFSNLAKQADEINIDEDVLIVEDELIADEEEISLDDQDEILSLDDEISLDDTLELENDISLEDTLSIDDDFALEDDSNESVLDTEEAQKVKDLLDETEDEIDDDLLTLDNEIEIEGSLDEDLLLDDLEDNTITDETLDEELTLDDLEDDSIADEALDEELPEGTVDDLVL